GANVNLINLDIDAQKIFLDTDTAIPCGLIINELVSNSLKYAFPDGKGEIFVKLHNYEDKILLSIGDNGKGLPDGFDLENSGTLGLRLVKTLVNQIDGTLELINDGGVEFRIIFKPVTPKTN
ncbi:MAG TPA: sensor histidine kinase, partial [Methanobacterium sp.]|nr:sensor histidine kinase [Methanobacterium sp.]